MPSTGLRIRDRAMNEKPQERVFLGRGTGRQETKIQDLCGARKTIKLGDGLGSH